MSAAGHHERDRDIAEVGSAIAAARGQIETLFVRGLATASAADLKGLAQQADEWQQLGAVHVAARIAAFVQAANGNSPETARLLLTAYTSLAVLERVLSVDVAAATFAQWPDEVEAQAAAAADEDEAEEEAPEAAPPAKGKARKVVAAKAKAPAKATKTKSSKTAKPTVPAKPGVIRTLREVDAAVAATPTAAPAPAAAPALDENAGLQMADELVRAVEELLRTGLVSATEATRAKLDATFKEASRHKLLRIGASLRYVNEEVGRYLADDGTFVARRFGLFLHRAWLLARGFANALRSQNRATAQRLAMGAGGGARSIKKIEVVTLGVLKGVVSTACTFDFKLRVVGGGPDCRDLLGRTVTWSFVFARKTASVPAEAYLHLPQVQKYVPTLLLEPNHVVVENCALTSDERGNLRMALGPPSTVSAGAAVTDWAALYQWNVAAAHARVAAQLVSPLDLAVETQEEVMLTQWSATLDQDRCSDERTVFCVTPTVSEAADTATFDAVVATGVDGVELKAALTDAAASTTARLPLYGVCYAENGRMTLLPLSYLTDQGPYHLMWSREHIDVASLMKTLTIG